MTDHPAGVICTSTSRTPGFNCHHTPGVTKSFNKADLKSVYPKILFVLIFRNVSLLYMGIWYELR